MDARTNLNDCGLYLERRGGRLFVFPPERITDDLRQFIRDHKTELLEAAPCASWTVKLQDGRTIAMLNPTGLTYAEALLQTRWRWPNCKVEATL